MKALFINVRNVKTNKVIKAITVKLPHNANFDNYQIEFENYENKPSVWDHQKLTKHIDETNF